MPAWFCIFLFNLPIIWLLWAVWDELLLMIFMGLNLNFFNILWLLASLEYASVLLFCVKVKESGNGFLQHWMFHVWCGHFSLGKMKKMNKHSYFTETISDGNQTSFSAKCGKRLSVKWFSYVSLILFQSLLFDLTCSRPHQLWWLHQSYNLEDGDTQRSRVTILR